MDATIYQLDAMRSQRNTRMFMERCFPMPLDSGGLALITGVTAFWVAYWGAQASYHHQILSAGFSPYLKSQKATAPPSGWR